MPDSILKTEEDYNKAILRLMEIFHVEPDSKEYGEVVLLIDLVRDYDTRHYEISFK